MEEDLDVSVDITAFTGSFDSTIIDMQGEDEINMDTRQQPRKKARKGNKQKYKHGASRRKALNNKEESAKDS